VIFIRGFLHLFLPFYRYRLNRAYEKEIEKQAENASSDLPEVPLTKEQILIRDEKLNRARIRANLDVNFHEYEVVFIKKHHISLCCFLRVFLVQFYYVSIIISKRS